MGYALHYDIDPTGTVAVPGTSSDPNPEFWEPTYKDGKGFILIEGSEETVHHVDWDAEERTICYHVEVLILVIGLS